MTTFQIGQVLPATKYLKIAWTETNAQAFIEKLPYIKMNSNNFYLVQTKTVTVQSDFDPLDIDTDYDVIFNANLIVSSWKNSLNRVAEFLLNCGENSGQDCQTKQYIIIDTSFWSAAKRTVTQFNAGAFSLFTWEDIAASQVLFQVYFNSMGGSLVDYYDKVVPNTLIPEPEDPVRSLFYFEGWYRESSYVTLFDFTTDLITETITLYAKWNFDETFIDDATTTVKGVVTLSDKQIFPELEHNSKAIAETNLKSVLQDIIDDFDEALSEVE